VEDTSKTPSIQCVDLLRQGRSHRPYFRAI